MNQVAHNKLISFIWSIADDCLRDVYVRGKYRDVILPMVVLRRLDTLLEPTKAAVLEEVRFQREEMKATELDDAPLTAASGYVFYNTSKWTLKQLYATATNNQQILLANVEEYLGGFSDNVKEIIARFKLLEQMRHMANKQVLLDVLEKFISPYINLTPHDAEDPDGNMMPGLSNLGMGYVFEELIRKFNEENNEEAGEHFTPREVIHLMTHLIFDPISGQLPPVMTIYDPACGSGGMLTEAQNYIKEPEGPIAAKGDVYLYGKEINDETYAICKSDMMIKGNNPENIKVGSTLATDEFSGHRFDFMLSNPPYGKSWKSDLKHIKDGNDVIDPRFQVELTDYWGKTETVDATPRSSDGQLLFLMEMVGKMKPIANSAIGSRIASVHNGSSLFTGDAGSGESNIRRFIIENDMLDTIIQLPNNLFYNTGKLATGTRGAALKMLHHIRSVSVHPSITAIESAEEFIDLSGRLKACFEIMDGIHSRGERVLVFIEHIQMQYRFIELLKMRYGLRHVDLINGSTPVHKRQDIVNRFQTHLEHDQGFDVLVLGPKAAGTGLTLTAATHVIHLSRWWNPAVEEQCNDRVHRIGQTKEVTIHIPMAIHGDFREKSFDCLLHSLMTRKRKLASSALWPMGDTDADAEQLQKMLAEEVRSADPGDPVQSAIKRTFERDKSPMPEQLDGQSYRYE